MAQPDKILVIDREESVCLLVSSLLEKMGCVAEWRTDAASALERSGVFLPDLVISGSQLPDMDGLAIQRGLRDISPGSGFILMTAHGSLDSAVKSLKEGALDYLIKPINPDMFSVAVRQALASWKQRREIGREKKELREKPTGKSLLGNSPQMIGVYRTVARIADSGANVMLVGETGTGKELISKSIHYNSPRAEFPFIAINCASIPETLLESELFGHVKGAFTGAIATRKGLFEEAEGGAVFLDEIGDISPAMQAKLLRVLQEKEVRKVGDNLSAPVNVRIIAATNRNLEADVAEKRFREDLYYRLNVVTIFVPPLRDRTDDIPLLALHFLETYAEEEDSDVEGISEEAMEILTSYRWPGNVRELESVIERAVIICRGAMIGASDLPERITGLVTPEPGAADERHSDLVLRKEGRLLTYNELEREYLIQALREAGWDKSRAARLMGIGRRTLYRMMERHGIELSPPVE